VNDRESLIEALAAGLEELSAFKPASKADLGRWYELARKLEGRLVAKGGLSSELPSLLWNYLADADIRMKDERYAELQDRQMRLLVRYLRRGEIPSEEELREHS
jgi:hypothetical protein